MYAAHFAAALAVKGRVPQAPTGALMAAAFLPDFIWIALARSGVEPQSGLRGFFDDWSHSLLTILVWASLFAWAFWRRGRVVVIAVWIAGLSHFCLDFLIHPARLALYPHSAIRLGWNLWSYGRERSQLGPTHYWSVEASVVVLLLTLYVLGSRRGRSMRAIVAASCLLVGGLHLLSLG